MATRKTVSARAVPPQQQTKLAAATQKANGNESVIAQTEDSIWVRYEAITNELMEASGFDISVRNIVNGTIALFAYIGAFYVGIMLTDALLVGAIAMSVSGFWLFAIALFGIIVSMLAAMAVGNITMHYVKKFDVDAFKAKAVSFRDNVTSRFVKVRAIIGKHRAAEPEVVH